MTEYGSNANKGAHIALNNDATATEVDASNNEPMQINEGAHMPSDMPTIISNNDATAPAVNASNQECNDATATVVDASKQKPMETSEGAHMLYCTK